MEVKLPPLSLPATIRLKNHTKKKKHPREDAIGQPLFSPQHPIQCPMPPPGLVPKPRTRCKSCAPLCVSQTCSLQKEKLTVGKENKWKAWSVFYQVSNTNLIYITFLKIPSAKPTIIYKSQAYKNVQKERNRYRITAFICGIYTQNETNIQGQEKWGPVGLVNGWMLATRVSKGQRAVSMTIIDGNNHFRQELSVPVK